MTKPIVNFCMRSEFSFKQTFGRVKELAPFENGTGYLGIADINNTFSHTKLRNLAKEHGLKPIYAVRLEVIADEHLRSRGVYGPVHIFVAKSAKGFEEMNGLVRKAWDNFYYKPMVSWSDVAALSEEVIVIAENIQTLDDYRLDYLALTPSTSPMLLDLDIPKVYCQNNFYPTMEEKEVYQLIAGTQKRGDDYFYKFDTKTVPQHVLSAQEFDRHWRKASLEIRKEALENTYKIAEQCDVEIPIAPMVTYEGPRTIEAVCEEGAKKLGIDLTDPVYKERYEREMRIIKEKGYTDYFMITADMIWKAKKQMLVGPARGSSGGSLVCYLMEITTINPIEHGLIFERFIDINREDLPDIDVDFPDNKRDKVIKQLFKDYGDDNVCHISNINLMKAKSAIGDFGLALRIPKYEVDPIKESIMNRSGGDARAEMTIEDTLTTTEMGQAFIEKYPKMMLVTKAQNHASHAGKHAAGIIVCNEPIAKFGAINSREGSIMMDKHGAEELNLLKIDCLGLRTLSVLEDCAKQIGMDPLDYYKLPTDDQEAFKIFNEMRLHGIFQFEGQAMAMITKEMGIENFSDIVVITALARPGPLHSGGANRFVAKRTGREPTKFICDHPAYIEATGDTYGEFIYQEQLMNVCKNLANMTWEDVSAIRKAVSKSKGEAFFNKYKKVFAEGCLENGVEEEVIEEIWESMMTFGSWGMNKSHTVAYGYISYWCAYMKAHHPLEFTAANLRHSKGVQPAIRILRDAHENEGIQYIPVDPDLSDIDWSVKNGTLLGGLIGIKGIAISKARDIIKMRKGEKKYTPSIVNKLLNPVTDFDTIYPCKDLWGDIYENYIDYGLGSPPSFIREIQETGRYIAIGKVMKKDLRDLNEYNELVKRNGRRLEENDKFLKLVIEDDTGEINCRINRFNFDDLNGAHFAEHLVEEESWIIVMGDVKPGWRILDITHIFDLKDLTSEDQTES